MKALNPGDFVRTDIETNKKFTLTETSSLLVYGQGERQVGTFNTASAEQSNGFYKGPLYSSIKSQFYLEPYRPQTTQSLHSTASIIQLSQTVFDEKIKEGSVTLVSGSDTFYDDENGNLYLSGSLSTKIGNVFYEFGAIIITDTGSYVNVGSGSFDLTFRGTHTKTQLDFAATVQPNEFNYSTNPTAIINGKNVLDRPRYSYNVSDVSSSYGGTITSQSIIPEFLGIYPTERILNTEIVNYVKRSTPDITSNEWDSLPTGSSDISQSLNVEAPPISGSWQTSASLYTFSGSQGNKIRGDLGKVFNDNEKFAVSLYARTDTSGSSVNIGVSQDNSDNISLDTSWQRITYTASKDEVFTEQDYADITFLTSSVDYYVWGFQVEVGNTVNEFIETTGFTKTVVSSSTYTSSINEDTERLNPYVTTIGYYNDIGDLLAIAKLASPTPIPNDFPITFKSRIDI